MRASPTSLLLAGVLCASEPAQALTTYRIGIGIQTGFNSQLIRRLSTQASPDAPTDAPALLFSASPWGQLQVESGRITEVLRYQFLINGFVLLLSATPAYSYQNTISSQTRVDLTSRLQWNLGVLGTQGQINSFAQAQDPASREISGINLTATDFISAGATSTLLWDPTARVRVTQPIAFRAFIPYGTIATTQAGNPDETVERNATPTLQSYALDAGLGMDYQFARASLGGEVQLGWFRPQAGFSALDPSILTLRGLARTAIELSPRWRATAELGAFAGTQGRQAFQQATTVIAPVGGAMVSYLFPRIESTLALSYQHLAAGEVFLGRLTESDLVSLRASVPLPKNFGVSASAGYRYARFTTADRPMEEGAPPPSAGQNYHMVQVDAGLGWQVRDGVTLFSRYQYLRQNFTGEPAPGALGLQDYDGHLAFVGVGLVYPTR